jgi:hypothetical protein
MLSAVPTIGHRLKLKGCVQMLGHLGGVTSPQMPLFHPDKHAFVTVGSVKICKSGTIDFDGKDRASVKTSPAR